MSAATVIDALPVVVRGLLASDHSLILSSWLRNNEPPAKVDRSIYFQRHESLIKRALAEHPEWFRMLVNVEDTNQIYGWVCADEGPRVLHFVFVKPAFRRMGFARQLLSIFFKSEQPLIHSHDAPKLRVLRLGSHFDPYSFGGTP